MLEIMLIVLIIISAGAILGGYVMKCKAPMDKEMKYGIRTSSTQKNTAVWAYANRTCGKSWLITGIIYIILGVPVILFMYHFKGEYLAKILSLIYLISEVIILASSVTAVLRDITNKFDENGNQKEDIKE